MSGHLATGILFAAAALLLALGVRARLRARRRAGRDALTCARVRSLIRCTDADFTEAVYALGNAIEAELAREQAAR